MSQERGARISTAPPGSPGGGVPRGRLPRGLASPDTPPDVRHMTPPRRPRGVPAGLATVGPWPRGYSPPDHDSPVTKFRVDRAAEISCEAVLDLLGFFPLAEAVELRSIAAVRVLLPTATAQDVEHAMRACVDLLHLDGKRFVPNRPTSTVPTAEMFGDMNFLVDPDHMMAAFFEQRERDARDHEPLFAIAAELVPYGSRDASSLTLPLACCCSAELGAAVLDCDPRQRLDADRSALWAAATYSPDLVPALLKKHCDPFHDRELALQALKRHHPQHPSRHALCVEMRWRECRDLVLASTRGSLCLPGDLLQNVAKYLRNDWS